MPAYPSSPKPSSCTIRSSSPTYVSTAQNLRRTVSSRNAHRWAFELKYPPMTRAEFAPLWAFLVDQQGQAGAFDFVLPEHSPLGSVNGTPLVYGAGQTGKTLLTDGWTHSYPRVLQAGDFIRIGSDYKTYMVTADADSDEDGSASISLNTPLAAIPDDDAAVFADSQFRCSLNEDDLDTDLTVALHYGLTIQLIEVLF